jgi:hypothetical protein
MLEASLTKDFRIDDDEALMLSIPIIASTDGTPVTNGFHGECGCSTGNDNIHNSAQT